MLNLILYRLIEKKYDLRNIQINSIKLRWIFLFLKEYQEVSDVVTKITENLNISIIAL